MYSDISLENRHDYDYRVSTSKHISYLPELTLPKYSFCAISLISIEFYLQFLLQLNPRYKTVQFVSLNWSPTKFCNVITYVEGFSCRLQCLYFWNLQIVFDNEISNETQIFVTDQQNVHSEAGKDWKLPSPIWQLIWSFINAEFQFSQRRLRRRRCCCCRRVVEKWIFTRIRPLQNCKTCFLWFFNCFGSELQFVVRWTAGETLILELWDLCSGVDKGGLGQEKKL